MPKIIHRLSGTTFRPVCGEDSWDNTARPEKVSCPECQTGGAA